MFWCRCWWCSFLKYVGICCFQQNHSYIRNKDLCQWNWFKMKISESFTQWKSITEVVESKWEDNAKMCNQEECTLNEQHIGWTQWFWKKWRIYSGWQCHLLGRSCGFLFLAEHISALGKEKWRGNRAEHSIFVVAVEWDFLSVMFILLFHSVDTY